MCAVLRVSIHGRSIISSAHQNRHCEVAIAIVPIKPCFVYLLQTCDDGAAKSYVGWTVDLEQRLSAHNSGKGAKSTRGRQWRLVHSESFKTRGAAMAREYELKKSKEQRARLLNKPSW
jgi:putative endonuclease